VALLDIRRRSALMWQRFRGYRPDLRRSTRPRRSPVTQTRNTCRHTRPPKGSGTQVPETRTSHPDAPRSGSRGTDCAFSSRIRPAARAGGKVTSPPLRHGGEGRSPGITRRTHRTRRADRGEGRNPRLTATPRPCRRTATRSPQHHSAVAGPERNRVRSAAHSRPDGDSARPPSPAAVYCGRPGPSHGRPGRGPTTQATQAAATAGALSRSDRCNTSVPSAASTRTVSPATKRPSRIARASGSTKRFWITRLSGRAP
jgi:hypothetical protein